jgi:hypothetical protein
MTPHQLVCRGNAAKTQTSTGCMSSDRGYLEQAKVLRLSRDTEEIPPQISFLRKRSIR